MYKTFTAPPNRVGRGLCFSGSCSLTKIINFREKNRGLTDTLNNSCYILRQAESKLVVDYTSINEGSSADFTYIHCVFVT